MPKRRMEEIRAEIEKAKERIRRGGLVRQGNDWQKDLAMVLAGFAFENAKLSETYSVDSINDFWNKNVQYYKEKAEDFVSKRKPEDIRKAALKSDNGKELTSEFRRYQSRLDELPDDPDGRNYPIARTRVLGIKERMEKGEFDTPEKKRFALSQLIGAREQVGAGRGSTLYFHPGLANRLKPGLSDIVKNVRADLDKLPDEQIDRLFSMTLHYGHGGAMHEEFENLRRTPVEKEIQRLSRVVNDTTLEDDAIKRTAAEMIWLKRHNDLPRQEQQQILQSEDREQEITDILNSPEFTQLFLNNSIMDINNTIKKPDAGELFEKMSEAEKDISSSPYSAMFDEIKNDHAKLQQLTQVFLGVSQDEALTGTLKNGAISQDLLRAVNEVTGILLDPEDKQGFIENMEKTCACLASFRLTNKKAFTKLSNEHPALKTLMDQLPMPKENSAGEFEMALKANILITNRKPDNEVDTTFFRKLALLELVGNEPGWEDKILSKEDMDHIEKRQNELWDAAQNKTGRNDWQGIFSDDGFSNERVYHILAQEGPESVKKHMDKWEVRVEAERKAAENQTPREYLEEKLKFPIRERVKKGDIQNIHEARDAFDEVLIGRIVAEEVAKHPEILNSKESVDEAFNKVTEGYRARSEGLKISNRTIHSLIYSDEKGDAVLDTFRKAVVGAGDLSRLKYMRKEDLPTAKMQIEGLQKNAKNNVYKDLDDKIRCIAQIIAIRETMNIKPGGDKKLNNRLTGKVFFETLNNLDTLQHMPQKDIEKLFSKVQTGHGGELMKEYHALNTYEKHIQNFEKFLSGYRDHSPERIAEYMALKMQTSSGKHMLSQPCDRKVVESIQNALLKEPAFIEMTKDRNTMKMAKSGDFKGLTDRLLNEQKKIDSQKEPVHKETVIKQPENFKVMK